MSAEPVLLLDSDVPSTVEQFFVYTESDMDLTMFVECRIKL